MLIFEGISLVNTLIKSIFLGTSLMLTVAYTGAFDFQMDDEDAPRKVSQKPAKKPLKKVSQKSLKKPKSKAGKKAQKINKAAKKRATLVATRPASSGVQDQIRLLHKKIDSLESGILATPTSASASTTENKSGHIPIEGTNTVLKIGGYIKADGIYDASQFTGDSTNLANLRLRHLDADAARTNVITAHAKQTRISLGSETQTSNGQVMAYFEGDFFGSTNNGSQVGSFSRSDTSSLNSYNFRVRHAYGSYCYNKNHRVDVGQMWTLFYDPRSTGTTIEFNGPETTAQIRRPQIRYTCAHKRWKFAFSVESGATEYLDISPTFVGTINNNGVTNNDAGSPSAAYNPSQYRRAQNSFLGGVTGDGNQGLPDLVAQILYEKKNVGHFSLGLMGRQLKVKKITSTGPNDPAFNSTKYGYGVALGGRYFIHEKSNIFGQLNFGSGIGAYIFGLDGYGAALDSSRKVMRTQFCYGGLIGVEHYWHEKWRSNLIFSIARANVSGLIPAGRVSVIGIDTVTGQTASIAQTGYSISNMLRQFYVNLMWAPAEKFEVGLEYAYLRRDTINNYFGYGNRFQFGAYYKF
jgi:hypothetical protein